MLANERQYPVELVGQGRLLVLQGDLGTYATGGIDLKLERFGFAHPRVVLVAPQGGYLYQWNPLTRRLHVYDPTNFGSLTFVGSALAGHNHTFTGSLMGTHSHDLTVRLLESRTVTANASQALAHLPAAVNMAYADDAGSVGPKVEVPDGGLGPAAGQFSVNYTTGVLTFANADAVANCLVTYVQKIDGAALNSAGTPAGTLSSDSAGTPAGTIGGQTDVKAAEVANATDLSAVTGLVIMVLE